MTDRPFGPGDLTRGRALPGWPGHAPATGTQAAHGTDTRYHYKRDPCRCDDCKAAHRAAHRTPRRSETAP